MEFDTSMQQSARANHRTVPLPDGRSLRLRGIRPEDRDALLQGFRQLSPASVRDRCFNVRLNLSEAELDYLTRVDFVRHVALVAEVACDDGYRPAAVGRFVRIDETPGHAELAITVVDDYQGIGVGSALLRALIDCARELGLSHLDATVFAENRRVVGLLRGSGLPLESRFDDGLRNLSLALETRAP